jgi:hypothetical protein
MMVCGFHQSLEDEDEWNEKHFLVFGELNHTTTISEIVKSQRMNLLLTSFNHRIMDFSVETVIIETLCPPVSIHHHELLWSLRTLRIWMPYSV